MDTTRQPPDHAGMAKSVSDMANAAESPERLITVDEFDRMLEHGIIGPDERLELIEGRLVRREPVNAPHASIVARLTNALAHGLRGRALVWPQLPIVAAERSKPFPDVSLVRTRADHYGARLPVPDDVLAVIEVSDTRLRFDRGDKLRLYAKAGIAEYWIVDVNARTIELCRDRHDLGYGSRTVATSGDSVAFQASPNVLFSVDELLGAVA